MEKRTAMLVVALVVVSICSSVVVALPPMGPPKAMVGQDQWTVGIGFSHGEMNLETHGKRQIDVGAGIIPESTIFNRLEIEDLKTNMVLGSLGFGVSDSWDVFVSVGAADAKADMTEEWAIGAGGRYTGFDSSHEFCYGLGSRASFWEDGDITWGGLFQIIWQNPDSDITLVPEDPGFFGPTSFTGNAELDFWELQIAVGPTWEGDNFRVYGGPFLHIVDGDIDLDATGVDEIDTTVQIISSGDVMEASQFGGYAGAQWLMHENIIANVEIQFTADAWAVGLGAVWKFE